MATTMSTPCVQRLDLLLDAGAAVDGGEPQAARLGRAARARRAPGGPARGWARARWPWARLGSALATRCEQREAEGEGLARAGLGLAAHVAAGEGVGDGERLDGKGLVDAACRVTRTADCAGDTPSAPNPLSDKCSLSRSEPMSLGCRSQLPNERLRVGGPAARQGPERRPISGARGPGDEDECTAE